MNVSRVWAFFILRMIAGAIFLTHGIDKWFRMDYNTAMFENYGLTRELMLSVGALEILAGFSFLKGMAIKIAAVVLTLIMAGAIVIARFSFGLIGGYDLPLAMFAICLLFVFTNKRNHSFSLILSSTRSFYQNIFHKVRKTNG
ncbi:DoxX family protein [Alkalicoccus halolimnae]|uniref:DoxX family protein n=1 Tax=Alkalicoccus halolimnae TaxID=1667239 RepID=A0A5C7FBZ6_9BACI|nr:DoxX family protein [Alkalicoccus halolimnae]TXF81089.1 DoxX family protein [Alkalicoccus halolimnae]